jgi:riboflavin synthase
MFTGLITGVGSIRSVTAIGNGQDARFIIQTPNNDVWKNAQKKLGASIACSGVCLTVIDSGTDWFTVEVSAETLSKTNLGDCQPGTEINLEGSLRQGDELGGHLVSGHVDGLATVLSMTPENGSTRWVFELPPTLAPFVAAKGSIALNGVSLTVNEVEGLCFGVNIIAHTAEQTNFATLHVGNRVNVEIDMLARYLARQLSFKNV